MTAHTNDTTIQKLVLVLTVETSRMAIALTSLKQGSKTEPAQLQQHLPERLYQSICPWRGRLRSDPLRTRHQQLSTGLLS